MDHRALRMMFSGKLVNSGRSVQNRCATSVFLCMFQRSATPDWVFRASRGLLLSLTEPRRRLRVATHGAVDLMMLDLDGAALSVPAAVVIPTQGTTPTGARLVVAKIVTVGSFTRLALVDTALGLEGQL